MQRGGHLCARVTEVARGACLTVEVCAPRVYMGALLIVLHTEVVSDAQFRGALRVPEGRQIFVLDMEVGSAAKLRTALKVLKAVLTSVKLMEEERDAHGATKAVHIVRMFSKIE